MAEQEKKKKEKVEIWKRLTQQPPVFARLFPRGVIVGLTAAKTARYVSVLLGERERKKGKKNKKLPQLILNDTALGYSLAE